MRTTKYQLLVIISFAFLLPSIMTSANAQNMGGGSEPLTKEQQDYCIKYEISPCTQNNILAKEKVLSAPSNQYWDSPVDAPIPIDWSIVGIVIVAVVAVVAVAVVAIKVKRPATTPQN